MRVHARAPDTRIPPDEQCIQKIFNTAMRGSLDQCREGTVAIDVFEERLAMVRRRFVSTLGSKIEDIYAALPRMSGQASDVVSTVAETYRRIHGICGIGPTIGLVPTGNAARVAEGFLLAAYRAQRGLTAEELMGFTRALHALRDAVQRDLDRR
jgi:hypothetical protein